MMKRNSAWIFSSLLGGALALLAGSNAMANHAQFSIDCEHTIFPSCCTAIHQSAGANANYSWTADKGWLERRATTYPWNWHHCGFEVGGFNIYTSIDNGVAFGHGKPYCPGSDLL